MSEFWGTFHYVFGLLDHVATRELVETGALLGSDIVVYGITFDEIISDARGIRDGQKIADK